MNTKELCSKNLAHKKPGSQPVAQPRGGSDLFIHL